MKKRRNLRLMIHSLDYLDRGLQLLRQAIKREMSARRKDDKVRDKNRSKK